MANETHRRSAAVESGHVRLEDSCLKQAATWIVRLNSDQVSETLLDELKVWLDDSPANRAAFRRMEHIWSRLDLVTHALGRARLAMQDDER